jgi:acyl-CoA reductase-like NAD-dependent aldehyde dehydrogenase
MTPMARERVLHRLADLIEEHADELAGYDALESGKPVTFVRAVDLELAIEQFRYYAGWPSKIQGATLPVESAAAHAYTRRVPFGVVAAITPWSFPFCQAAIKLAPALAAGNTAVIKPSELTSLSTLRLAELAIEAGLPEGVLNVVTGTGATAGDALVRHSLVEKITSTGSERVGRSLGQQATADLKHVSLELGGKNPHVIFADADLEKAIESAATTAFFYTGQVCFAGSRLLVERPVFDEVVAGLESTPVPWSWARAWIQPPRWAHCRPRRSVTGSRRMSAAPSIRAHGSRSAGTGPGPAPRATSSNRPRSSAARTPMPSSPRRSSGRW